VVCEEWVEAEVEVLRPEAVALTLTMRLIIYLLSHIVIGKSRSSQSRTRSAVTLNPDYLVRESKQLMRQKIRAFLKYSLGLLLTTTTVVLRLCI